MNVVEVLISIGLIYLAVGSLILVFAAAYKVKCKASIAIVGGGILVGVALAATLARAPFSQVLSVLALTTLGCLAAYRLSLKPKMHWQTQKELRIWRRQIVVHLVLVTGSAVFLVPFLWLATTSLKEDEDMSRFPPVWIPQQQVKINIDGKQAGLATAMYEGQKVKVAVLKERESGEREMRILEPENLKGREFTLPRSQVTKIKQFAPVWNNYPAALKYLPKETKSGLVFFGNTLTLSVLTIIGTLLSSSLVAFSFARLKWQGRDSMFIVVLATMMLPAAVTMMPAFLIFRWLGWIDSLKPLWVPAFLGRDALYIFLLRQFFLTIPNDLEDAAKIDGCSYFGIYWRIMLPLIKPALAAITIMTFMAAWNNFMGPLIYVSSPTRMPLAYALQLFQTAHGGEPGLLMAAATMMIIPVVLLFFLTQRYFIQGVTLTGIKG